MIMSEHFIDNYLSIRAKTYHVFERDFLAFLSKLSSETLTLKDVNFLFQVNTFKKNPPTPKLLLASSSVSIKMISKRMGELEKKGFLMTSRNPEDHREKLIYLTDTGFSALRLYQDLLRDFSISLSQSLSLVERYQFVKSLIKIANELSGFKPLTLSFYDLRKANQIAEIALNRIYEGVIAWDLNYLEEHHIDFKLRDFRVLVEIYLQSSFKPITLIDLYDPLLIPLPTLSRVVQRLSPEWIDKKLDKNDKRKSYLSIQQSKIDAVEAFIINRIEFYQMIEDWAGEKPFKSILKAFAVALSMTQEVPLN